MARKSHTRTVDQTKVVTTASGVRIETPKSERQKKPLVTVLVGQDINPVVGFVGFLREHAVVGLAIGFVIGTQAQALVKQLVSSFIDPLFQLLFGVSLNQRVFAVQWHGRAVPFHWGAFAYALLNFMFVLAAIYLIVKFFNLDKLDKVKEDA